MEPTLARQGRRGRLQHQRRFAVISGAVTSGLGYALWYAVVPHLGAARAAVVQLTVPLIAAAGGLVLIGEVPGPAFYLASVLVLGGVAWASKPAGNGTVAGTGR